MMKGIKKSNNIGLGGGGGNGGNDGGAGNTQSFRQAVLQALSKIAEQSTVRTGMDEIHSLIFDNMDDPDRINIIIGLLGENNEHHRLMTKKEVLKIFSVLAETLEQRTIDYIPRIISVLSKKIKDYCNISELFHPIGDAVGAVVEHSLKNVPIQRSLQIVEFCFNFFTNSLIKEGANNKAYQVGCATCLTRLMQTSPLDSLIYYLSTMTQRLLDIIKDPHCKAVACVLEALLSLILAVEEKFFDYALPCLPIIIENIASSDWNVRKLCIDILYTLGVLMPTVLHQHKGNLLEILNECRSDKIKHVRDAALIAIDIIKDFPDLATNEVQIPHPMKTAGEPAKSEKKGPRIQPKFIEDVCDSPPVKTLPGKKPKKDKENTVAEKTAANSHGPPQPSFPASVASHAPASREEPTVQKDAAASTQPAKKEKAPPQKFVKPAKKTNNNNFEWNVEIVAKSPPKHLLAREDNNGKTNEGAEPANPAPAPATPTQTTPTPTNKAEASAAPKQPAILEKESNSKAQQAQKKEQKVDKEREKERERDRERDDQHFQDERPLPGMSVAQRDEIVVPGARDRGGYQERDHRDMGPVQRDPPPVYRDSGPVQRDPPAQREYRDLGPVQRDSNHQYQQQQQHQQQTQIQMNYVSVTEMETFKNAAVGEISHLKERVVSLESTVRELLGEIRGLKTQQQQVILEAREISNNCACRNQANNNGFFYNSGNNFMMKGAPTAPNQMQFVPFMQTPFGTGTMTPDQMMSQFLMQQQQQQAAQQNPMFFFNQQQAQQQNTTGLSAQSQVGNLLNNTSLLNPQAATGTGFRGMNTVNQSSTNPLGLPEIGAGKTGAGGIFSKTSDFASFGGGLSSLSGLGGMGGLGATTPSTTSTPPLHTIDQVLTYLNLSGSTIDKLDDKTILNIIDVLVAGFAAGGHQQQEESTIQWLNRIFELDLLKVPLETSIKLKNAIQRYNNDDSKGHDITFQVLLQRILKYLP